MFYEKCAKLLGTTYDCKPFLYRKPTRWNNRSPGEGRFPGFGLIRKFGNEIHVSLRYPVSHREIFLTEEKVIAFLESLSNR